MLILNYLFALLLSFGLVVATDIQQVDGPKHKSDIIINALKTIKNETLVLNDTLIRWDGTLMNALPIQTQNDKLLNIIKQSETVITKTSPKLGLISALKVKDATKDLVGTTRATVDTIVAMHERFQAVSLDRQVKNNLHAMREASQNLNKATEMKIPKIGRGTAKKLGREIDKIFEEALAVYDPKGKDPKDKNPKDKNLHLQDKESESD